MSVTGWKYPGTTATSGTDTDWTNPNNITADDTSYASVTLAGKAARYLCGSNFGFTSSDVPSGATIDGIEVVICKYSNGTIADKNVYITKTANTTTGSNLASASKWPTGSPTEVTYGGSTNKWGTTWSQSDIVGSGFGVMLSSSAVSDTLYVDYYKIRVYYTVSSGSLLLSRRNFKHMIVR